MKRPRDEHPKRPIEGFACRRREVSGQRLWEWARNAFDAPERFFARFFVLNYCPLCFLSSTGANVALDKLRVVSRRQLSDVCDQALRDAASELGVRFAIGLGGFATDRVRYVLGEKLVCGGAPHPSRANARVGQHWAREMDSALAQIGVSPGPTSVSG